MNEYNEYHESREELLRGQEDGDDTIECSECNEEVTPINAVWTNEEQGRVCYSECPHCGYEFTDGK